MPQINPWQPAERYLKLADSVLADLIPKYGPPALAPRSDYFTVLCDSIISQQLATKAAQAIFNRFSSYYNNHFTPEEILNTPGETLRKLGLSSRKVLYIHDLATNFYDGTLNPSAFPHMSDKELIQQLTVVKGIGVWTVHMFLIFALNRPDVLPTDDLGIRKAVMKQYNLDTLPDKMLLENLAIPWHPWCSVACWYLWRSLENN
ncbi:MAG: hypothetical protein H6Q67_2234 [Firmicutes bacterium]|nr:hypothetical protein [Bacillota bacterium]